MNVLLRWPLPLLSCALLLFSACGGGDGAPDASDGPGGCACDDGFFCNGLETCEAGECAPGLAPCDGACDEESDRCLDEDCADADGDGECSVAEGGTDCDDEDPRRFAGAIEVCDAAGVDEDCDPNTFGEDRDGDGYAALECCNEIDGELRCGGDCNDDSMEVNPEADEICDERDNDCDGTTDEGVQMLYYRDADNDNYGVDTETVFACSLPAGFTVRGGDCDDDPFDDDPEDPPANERNPGATEICNEIDDDCDGDPDPMLCPCPRVGDTRSCAEAGFLGACAVGDQTCTSDGWAGCPAPAAEESCGGGDEDCDGVSNEPGAIGSITCWVDGDGDDYASSGAATLELCSCGDGLTDRSPASMPDCNDGDAGIYPTAPERCDRVRNDCSSTASPLLEDADDDGYAPVGAACSGGFPATDCDDGNAAKNPAQTDYVTEPSCAAGTDEVLCAVAQTETRCLPVRSCPATCEVTDGIAPNRGSCSSGIPCTCSEPARRCLLRDCEGCATTEGTEPTEGRCSTGFNLCECYEEWVTSCEPTSGFCLLPNAGAATPPDDFDVNCMDGEELAPDSSDFTCTGSGATRECSVPCPSTGRLCDRFCPDYIVDSSGGMCGAGSHDRLTCRVIGTNCRCTDDGVGPLPWGCR